MLNRRYDLFVNSKQNNHILYFKNDIKKNTRLIQSFSVLKICVHVFSINDVNYFKK